MNTKRSPDQKISISSKETQRGIPIQEPGKNNVAILQERFSKLGTDIPREMYEVLWEAQSFTSDPPIDLVAYKKWALDVDRVYQGAIRWNLQVPYLNQYAQRKKEDIRGYYYLSQDPNRGRKLKDPKSLDVDSRWKYRLQLIGLCYNQPRLSKVDCSNEFGSVEY